MHWGPNVSIFACRPSFNNLLAWVGRAKVDAALRAYPNDWVRGVEYFGPPSCTIFGCVWPRPNIGTIGGAPSEFIIADPLRVRALSVNRLGMFSRCGVRRGRHELPIAYRTNYLTSAATAARNYRSRDTFTAWARWTNKWWPLNQQWVLTDDKSQVINSN